MSKIDLTVSLKKNNFINVFSKESKIPFLLIPLSISCSKGPAEPLGGGNSIW